MGDRGDTTYPPGLPYVDREGTSHLEGATVDTVIHTTSATLTADDSGKVHIADAVDLVLTLPATAAGLHFRFVVATVSVTTGLSVAPVAADLIAGLGFTAAVDKAAINTGATDVVGDALELVGDGSDGWLVMGATGTWAREA